MQVTALRLLPLYRVKADNYWTWSTGYMILGKRLLLSHLRISLIVRLGATSMLTFHKLPSLAFRVQASPLL